LRILYLVHQFFPTFYYGTERFTLNLAEQMQRLGHNPLVMTLDREQGQGEYTHLHGSVQVKRYTYRTVPVISFKTPAHKSHEIFDPEIDEAYKKLQLTHDIVHITHPMWLSSIAKSCKNQGTPVVLTLTDAWLLCPSSLIDPCLRLCNGPVFGNGCPSNCHFENSSIKMERYQNALTVLSFADVTATASRFTSSVFQRNGWNKPIRIIPHSVDYKFVKRARNLNIKKLTFAYIGSLAWHKGVHILVKAIRSVRADNVNVAIYGSMQENSIYIRDLQATAQGDPRIRFLGTFDMNSLPSIMENVSVLVVPSIYYDNYPLVTLISLAFKVPVIGSNIGGIPEIIKHDVNGLLFEPGSAAELASVISNIAREPNVIQRWSDNIVTPRRLEEEALEYENIYRTLTSRQL
jgi:glycosyltransferase involved in cell wall biosynthesis